MRFAIGGKRVTCRESKTINSLGRTKLTNSLRKKNNLKFRLARDQVVFLETAGKLLAGHRKANNSFAVFSSFVLEGVTKHLMTGPTRNSELFFHSTLMYKL